MTTSAAEPTGVLYTDINDPQNPKNVFLNKNAIGTEYVGELIEAINRKIILLEIVPLRKEIEELERVAASAAVTNNSAELKKCKAEIQKLESAIEFRLQLMLLEEKAKRPRHETMGEAAVATNVHETE